MERRSALLSLIASLTGAAAATQAAADAPQKTRVVYHLSDLEKVSFVLGNIRNHFEGVGGSAHVDIALVVHGPPLRAFRTSPAYGNIRDDFGALTKQGLQPFACRRTMDGMGLKLPDLLPGFVVAEQGGVVKLAEFQTKGYAYLRP